MDVVRPGCWTFEEREIKVWGLLKFGLLALPEESMNVGDVLKQGKARCVDVWCGVVWREVVVVVVWRWWWRLGASRGEDLGDSETGESRRHCLSGSNQRAGVWLTGCTLSRTGEEV